MTGCYLGLGSNMGDRRALLQAAVDALAAAGVRLCQSSSVYETDPVGEITDQRAFLNAAIEIEPGVEPADLLAVAKRVELHLGRDPDGPRHGPRPVDVDLLLLGDATIDADRLCIPHRDLLERRFVLVPLLELDFELVHPGGVLLADALAALPAHEQLVRLAGPPLQVAAGTQPGGSTPAGTPPAVGGK